MFQHPGPRNAAPAGRAVSTSSFAEKCSARTAGLLPHDAGLTHLARDGFVLMLGTGRKNCAAMSGPKHKNQSSMTRANLEEALLTQKSIQGDRTLASALVEKVDVLEIRKGDILIEQGADDHDIYFILAGSFEIVIHDNRIAAKGAGEHVGEMAAILTSLRRTATVRATEPGWVARLSATALRELVRKHKTLWQRLT